MAAGTPPPAPHVPRAPRACLRASVSHKTALCVPRHPCVCGATEVLCVRSACVPSLGVLLLPLSCLPPLFHFCSFFWPSHTYVSHLHGVIWPSPPQQDRGAQNTRSRASSLIDTQLCFLPGRVIKNHCCRLRSLPHLECVGGMERPPQPGLGGVRVCLPVLSAQAPFRVPQKKD